MTGSTKEILIVGAGPQALFLVREYSRLAYKVTLVGRENEIAMHSRYGKKIRIKNEQDLIAKLSHFAGHNQGMDCLVASGFYLAYLMDHYPEFFSQFNAIPKDTAALSIFLNKVNTYQLAEKVNCKCPKSIILSDLNDEADCSFIHFPQIVKWNQDIFLYEKPGFKTCLIQNLKELKNLCKALNTKEKEALVMQTYLGESLEKNFSYGAYFKNGKLVAGICVNEVRHFRSGVSSLVEEYTGEFADTITGKSIDLIGQTQFTGFLDVEFKIYNGEAYLLEVNPRPFGFIKILKLKYPDLIQFIIGEKESHSTNPKPVKWMNVLRDCVLIAKNPSKLFHMLSILFDFNNRTLDVWDISDLKPFFYQVKR